MDSEELGNGPPPPSVINSVGSGSHFYSSGWDPVVLSSQNSQLFGNPNNQLFGLENQTMIIGGGSSSGAVNQFTSITGLSSDMMMQKAPRSGDFSNAMNSFGGPPMKDDCPDSPNAKRKRKLKSAEVEQSTMETDDVKKTTTVDPNSHAAGCKNAKQSSSSYVHVRAKRGQATNSHSLAERVRRERISERMKLLQELVPGCSKITGKAVMLDEIINYVQSLQQQVEFLSMKLASVNPEINMDIERVLSNDVLPLHPHLNNSGATLGIGSGLSFQGLLLPQITLADLPPPPFHHRPSPNLWNPELQSGFESNRNVDDSLETNGDDYVNSSSYRDEMQ